MKDTEILARLARLTSLESNVVILMRNKILGVIPARYGSTRLPGKALADIVGKPMIQHVYEQAVKAITLDDLVVATDDRRIYDTVEEFGGKAVMTDEHPSGTDRMAEVARAFDVDLFVNIQGDEPMIDPESIDAVVEQMAGEDDKTIGMAAFHIQSEQDFRDTNIVKAVINHAGYALYYSRLPVPFSRDRDWDALRADVAYGHVGIYALRKEQLELFANTPPSQLEMLEKIEQLRFFELGYKLKVAIVERSMGVDTESDLILVREAMGVMVANG